MKESSVRKKLKDNKPVYGIISPTTDSVLTEIIGYLGFDFYMLDGEHGAINPAQAVHLIRACEVTGITPLARIRSIDPKLILQYMDAGLMGVMMPGVKTVTDVEALVKAIKYPPLGDRGLGPVKAADYLLDPTNQLEYMQFANEQTLVLPQVENMEAVENLKGMTEVPGVDGFIIGPRDLAISMGFYDGPNHEEVRKVINRIFDIVLGEGFILGTVAGTKEQAQALIHNGAKIILNSLSELIKQSSKAFLS